MRRASLPLGDTLGRMIMSLDAGSMDQLFLAQAKRRLTGVILPARIEVQNLAQEFATLSERDAIPEPLRDHYHQVATLLAGLVTDIQEAEAQTTRILGEAAEELPPPSAPLAAVRPANEEISRACRSLDAAERQAWDLLSQIQFHLRGGRWAEAMAHAHARVSLVLDPGSGHQQYWLEDTGFNLLELPTSTQLWRECEPEPEGENRPCPALDGSQMELAPQGEWLRYLLSQSVLEWEQLPMVRTIYVDFDLGTGMEVPGSWDESLVHRVNPGTPRPPDDLNPKLPMTTKKKEYP